MNEWTHLREKRQEERQQTTRGNVASANAMDGEAIEGARQKEGSDKKSEMESWRM
jgi:hypothetical protein